MDSKMTFVSRKTKTMHQKWRSHDDMELSHTDTDSVGYKCIELEAQLKRSESLLYQINSYLVNSTTEVILRVKPTFDEEKLKLIKVRGIVERIYKKNVSRFDDNWNIKLNENTEFSEWNDHAHKMNSNILHLKSLIMSKFDQQDVYPSDRNEWKDNKQPCSSITIILKNIMLVGSTISFLVVIVYTLSKGYDIQQDLRMISFTSAMPSYSPTPMITYLRPISSKPTLSPTNIIASTYEPTPLSTAIPTIKPKIKACSSSMDYLNMMKQYFKTFIYFDTTHKSHFISSTLQIKAEPNWENTNCYASLGVFGGGYCDLSKGRVTIKVPSKIMDDEGLIISTWVYASESKKQGSTSFGCIAAINDRSLCTSDEEVFNARDGSVTFRVTHWFRGYQFLIGGARQGSSNSEFKLHQWTHILIHVTKTSQQVYFNGVVMEKIYILGLGRYVSFAQPPSELTISLPSTSTRDILKVSHFAVIFGRYTIEEALKLFTCDVDNLAEKKG